MYNTIFKRFVSCINIYNYFTAYSVKFYSFTHNKLIPIIWKYTNNTITFYKININITSIYKFIKRVQYFISRLYRIVNEKR